ncbi:MAG: AMP-binding protein [Syntrophus sp. (in: bacteria)]|nr:AMP-binding protein [Syntrophus sp. (in: bacteria)]
MNLAQNLETSASFFPDRSAIRENNLNMTYTQLNYQANRIATGLIKMGIKPGEHVGLCAPNSAEWIVFYFGVLKAGAVAVTLSSLLSKEELVLLIDHAKPRFLYTTEARLNDLKPFRDSGLLEKTICPGGDLDMSQIAGMGSGTFKAINRDRKSTAAILYTGGTTGTPKGVMLTHEGINFSSIMIAHLERSCETDVALCFMPFNHVFGQIHIMNSTIFSGGCLELLPSFDLERILKLTESGRITKFYSVPTVYIRLLTIGDLKKKMGKVRYCFSAGASMAMEIVKQWKEKTGITIIESFGQTEGMPITFNHYYPEKHVVGSVGQDVYCVETQIRSTSGKLLKQGQEGEICVRGPMVMKGYLNNPKATKDAFWGRNWLRTGDIGRQDANGYVYIVDRLKELIITGGENVYPREVEEILYTIPEVGECAVVGLPDKEWGEKVAAFIVPKEGKIIIPDQVKALLKTRLAPFKVPKEYVIVDILPKSTAGKILKRELKRTYVEGTTLTA